MSGKLPNDDLDVDTFNDEDGRTPAAPGSVRSTLAERRAKAAKKLHLDLPVPRLDPPVFVRYAPIPAAKITAANERVSKQKKNPQAEIIANAALLADACIGVFELIDDEEVSVLSEDRDGEWPTFAAQELAAELGVQARTAADVVRNLYLTDGDIISTVGKIAEWSGYATEQDERDPEGN